MQDIRVGKAAARRLRDLILPSLQALVDGGKPRLQMAELEARSSLTKMRQALEHFGAVAGDETPSSLVGMPDEVIEGHADLRREYRELAARVDRMTEQYATQVKRDTERRRKDDERAKEEAARAAKPPLRPGGHVSKHVALPPVFDVGKCDPGQAHHEQFPLFNLVGGGADVTLAYAGDSSISLERSSATLPPVGQHPGDAGSVKLLFQAPAAHGTHKGTVTVTIRWYGDALPAEQFVIPVVAHSMYPHEKTDDEQAGERQRAADQRAELKKKETADEKARRELADFSKKNPKVDTDRVRDLVGKMQIQMRNLATKQQAGVTLAEQQVGKYKRMLPPKASNLWWNVAMFALDIASAGIAGRVGKAIELGMKEAKIPGLIEIAKGPLAGAKEMKEVAKWPSHTVIQMFTDGVKEAIKGGSKRARAAAEPGDDRVKEDGDRNRDAAALFFADQRVGLSDRTADREAGIIDAAAALRPLIAADEEAALRALQVAHDKLAAEAAGKLPMLDQAQESVEAWTRVLSEMAMDEKGSPVELRKTADVRDHHEVRTFDGMLDISFRVGNRPSDPVIVTGARMLGVSDTVAKRFQNQPLLNYNVTVRAYGKGGAGTNYAEIPITVVRYANGVVHFKQQDMGAPGQPMDYLSRKVYRRGSAAELGARKLIEEEIMSKSLDQHGVTIEHDHDRG